MYHLVLSTYECLTSKDEYSVLILGLDNAGKTTLLEQIKSIFSSRDGGGGSSNVEKTVPTVGQNVGRIISGKNSLKFWDVGGQHALRSLWSSYYAEAHAIVFVVDSTDSARLNECQQTLLTVVMHENTEGIPILMLANKQDMPQSMGVEDIKEIFNPIASHLSARDSRVLPISALKGTGVKDAIDWLVIRLERNKDSRPPN